MVSTPAKPSTKPQCCSKPSLVHQEVPSGEMWVLSRENKSGTASARMFVTLSVCSNCSSIVISAPLFEDGSVRLWEP